MDMARRSRLKSASIAPRSSSPARCCRRARSTTMPRCGSASWQCKRTMPVGPPRPHRGRRRTGARYLRVHGEARLSPRLRQTRLPGRLGGFELLPQNPL